MLKITTFFSALQPILDKNNVRLIGVGLEELGVQEFIDGKFFDGGNKQKIMLFWSSIDRLQLFGQKIENKNVVSLFMALQNNKKDDER